MINAFIDINSIKNNINYLRKKSKTEIMPVLKGNAYGHGLLEIAKIVRKLKIQYIGVATIGEAILLRKGGDKGNILAWLYNINSNELIEAFNLDIDIAIYDHTIISKFINLIPNNKKIKITLFIDTGINRAGIPYNVAIETFIKINKCPKIELVGLMSHLVCSEIKNSPIVNNQLSKFRKLREDLKNIGIIPPFVHIANTGGCMNYDVSDFTLSRVGKGIYGISPDFKLNRNLELSMSIKTNIIQLKELDIGEGIGYNWKYITSKKMKIAVLPFGFCDIFLRNIYDKIKVYVNGTKRIILGFISMDQICIETKKEDKLNDEVYIFGNGKNCYQTIYNIAKISNSVPSEILCHIGYRVYKNYI